METKVIQRAGKKKSIHQSITNHEEAIGNQSQYGGDGGCFRGSRNLLGTKELHEKHKESVPKKGKTKGSKVFSRQKNLGGTLTKNENHLE